MQAGPLEKNMASKKRKITTNTGYLVNLVSSLVYEAKALNSLANDLEDSNDSTWGNDIWVLRTVADRQLEQALTLVDEIQRQVPVKIMKAKAPKKNVTAITPKAVAATA